MFPFGQVTLGEFDTYYWKSISDHPTKFPKKTKKGLSSAKFPRSFDKSLPLAKLPRVGVTWPLAVFEFF